MELSAIIKQIKRIHILRGIFVTYYVIVFWALMSRGLGNALFVFHLFSSLIIFGIIAHFARGCGKALAGLHGPQTLGPMLDASVNAGMFFSVWREIKAHLTSQLLGLKASDAHCLESRHLEELRRLLSWDEGFPLYGRLAGGPLKLAILAGLEQIGDTLAIPTVKRLADKAADRNVKAAARDCLEALEQRDTRQKAAMSLLRPAECGGSQVLLRPAESKNEDVEVLLRPGA